MDNNSNNLENKKISHEIFIFPIFMILIISLVKMIEIKTNTNFGALGVLPQNIEGLVGVILSPFIHGSEQHLFNNIIPLFFLLSAMIHFYDKLSYLIYIIIHIASGLLLWIIGREVFHIGASGVVYGLASFMFFSGLFRKNTQLLAFSLLIAFLYGSMVWGIFPETVKKGVSWEAHLSGAIVGFIVSIIFINKGPQRKQYDWEEEEENQNDEDQNDKDKEYIYQ